MGEEDMAAFVDELKRAALAPQETYAPDGTPLVKHVIECKAADVAYIIGLRGERVSVFEQQSGAKVRVCYDVMRNRSVPATARVVIEGTSTTVHTAAAIVEQELEKVRSPRRVPCPRSLIGKVIGRNGERVKEIQVVSGATVQVDQRGDPCVVEISGGPQELSRASELVAASMEGRYASSLNRYNDAVPQAVDPYKELDRNWFPARDDLGRVYWYNATTGHAQWNRPF
ncbi:hypothetical protein CTAYLR_010806 [Chrysophaeum taylorii]|uniref:WW domain-containing protein n=1 Tax=Chrysophaeum taylorii TaxID=2483200 RepID=A0AAD7U9I7_9STRA|nr:hypothetical protein CTAYLR_010806 [Chrysophaeum taylorii]